jgi:hypothetical protein
MPAGCVALIAGMGRSPSAWPSRTDGLRSGVYFDLAPPDDGGLLVDAGQRPVGGTIADAWRPSLGFDIAASSAARTGR